MITRQKHAAENWVKYEFKIKGSSGNLQSVVIGDYLHHQDLLELQEEKKEFLNKSANKGLTEEQTQKLKNDYVPTDFSAYTIAEEASKNEELLTTEKLAKQEQIWRISSLTASVDDETKILVLPLPDSKRLVKVADTNYSFETYGDLI